MFSVIVRPMVLPTIAAAIGPRAIPMSLTKGAPRAKPLNIVEKGFLYLAALAAAVSLGRWLYTAVVGHFKALSPQSYEEANAVPDVLGLHHLVFLISAIVFLHLWEKSLPWRETLYYASGVVAVACLALCVLYPLCVFRNWIPDTHVRSHLIPISLGYFIAALVWARQREKRPAAGAAP